LPKPRRLGPVAGYRRYTEADVARLEFIRRAKALGFALAEITELLALSSNAQADMSNLNAAVRQHLQTVKTHPGKNEQKKYLFCLLALFEVLLSVAQKQNI